MRPPRPSLPTTDLKSASKAGPHCLLGAWMPARQQANSPEAPRAPKAPPPGGTSFLRVRGLHHITRPQNGSPLFLSVFLRTKKNSWLSATFPLRRRAALSCDPPGVHCGSGCIAGWSRCGLGRSSGGISVGTSREIRVKSQLARREKGLFRTYLEKVSILHGKTPSPNWVASRRGSSGRPQRSSSATEMPTA